MEHDPYGAPGRGAKVMCHGVLDATWFLYMILPFKLFYLICERIKFSGGLITEPRTVHAVFCLFFICYRILFDCILILNYLVCFWDRYMWRIPETSPKKFMYKICSLKEPRKFGDSSARRMHTYTFAGKCINSWVIEIQLTMSIAY